MTRARGRFSRPRTKLDITPSLPPSFGALWFSPDEAAYNKSFGPRKCYSPFPSLPPGIYILEMNKRGGEERRARSRDSARPVMNLHAPRPLDE